MGIAKESIELASLIQRSVFLGVPLGYKYLLKYNQLGETERVILTSLDYKSIGKVNGSDLEVYVPDGTMEIGSGAFGYDTYLLNFKTLKVYLPRTCSVIQKHAFNIIMLPLNIQGSKVGRIDSYSFEGLRAGSTLCFEGLYSESLSVDFMTTVYYNDISLSLRNFDGSYAKFVKERRLNYD